MLNRAKQQGPKTFCAVFQVAWDSTWLGCEGTKKTDTHPVKMGLGGLCLLCWRVPNTQLRASLCLLCAAQRESAPWVGGKEVFASFLWIWGIESLTSLYPCQQCISTQSFTHPFCTHSRLPWFPSVLQEPSASLSIPDLRGNRDV